MKIALAGGSGFIGRHLIDYWVKQGEEVLLITRKQASPPRSSVTEVTWQEIEANIDLLDGVEALVNLAGETINQRWTEQAKRRILQSRLDTTRQIARMVERMKRKPRVVINSSAVGIYGSSEEQVYTERSVPQPADFLASVVQQWEQAAAAIAGTRVLLLRIGLVIAEDGGALPKMYLPYKFGIGGKIGSGRQWVSWIQIEDLVRLVDFCLRNEQMAGPVNATAPHPVTNDRFGRTLAQVSGRPHWLPLPGFVLRLVFGEMADLLLQGQQVLPEKALAAGFEFAYPELKTAVEKTLKQNPQSSKRTP